MYATLAEYKIPCQNISTDSRYIPDLRLVDISHNEENDYISFHYEYVAYRNDEKGIMIHGEASIKMGIEEIRKKADKEFGKVFKELNCHTVSHVFYAAEGDYHIGGDPYIIFTYQV